MIKLRMHIQYVMLSFIRGASDSIFELLMFEFSVNTILFYFH